MKIPSNKTFELTLGLKLEELEKETQLLAYLQPYKQNLALKKKQLDPLSLLTFVESKFLSQYNANPCLWQPATGKTDPLKALLAQPNGVEDKNSLAQLILLAFKQSNKAGEGGVCFNCGASDHWAPRCPKKKQSGKNSKGGKKGNGGNGN